MIKKPILNIADVALSHTEHGDNFEAQVGSMATEIGAQKLGCRLIVVPPGKKAWPFHNHYANEEIFFVLEGAGLYRFGDATYPIKAGDLLSAPAGGAETAHQIINDSGAPLRYLAMSTMREPDIMEYPDSKKFGVFAGSAPGGAKADRQFSAFAFLDDTVGYWEDED